MTVRNDRNNVILFIVNDSWFFASHRLPIAKALILAGKEVHLAAHDDHSCEMIQQAGVVVHSWNLSPRSTSVFKELKSIWCLFLIVKRVQPGLVHLVTIKSVLYGGVIARLLRVPSAVFAISGLGYLFGNREKQTSLVGKISSALYRLSLRHANSAVIVQNKADEQFFIQNFGISSSQIYRLPGSGVDVNQFIPIERPSTHLQLVLAARMLWDKGIGVFADAAKILKKMEIPVECVLVGYSDEQNPRSVSPDQLRAWEAEGILRWAGHSNDMVEVLQQSHIFCLPTMYGEGLPKVVIEAAACGCAVVVSNWPGCNEIIEHEHNGLLITPGNADELVSAVIRLVEDPSMRNRLSQNARDTVERGYNVRTVIDQTLVIYNQLQNA